MPIAVVCPSCQRQFRVPDSVAGKKIKCPKCAGVLPVPAADNGGGGSAVGSGVGVGSSVNAGGSASGIARKWYMKTPDGNQYGPVPKPELDQWFAEGRITAQCQLLEEGSPQWQWGADVYPQLNPAAAASSQAVAGAGVPAPAPATDDNPFAGLGGGNPAPADNPFAGLGASDPGPTAAVVGTAAASNDPFSFAGANTSPTSRVRGGKRGGGGKRPRGSRGKSGPRSGAVTGIAVINYIFGVLGVIGGLLMAVLGAFLVNMIMGAAQTEIANSNDPQAAEAAQALGAMSTMGSTIFVGVGIIFIISSSITILAGYGVQIRAQWGRILTLVLGGLNVLGGLMSLLALSPSALLNIGYAVYVFVVLLNKKYADEFS